MPKNIEDMVVPERKRTIRDIPIPESRRKNHSNLPPPQTPKEHRVSEKKPRRRRGAWIISGIVLLAIVFVILSVFTGATLSYVPKSAELMFENDSYTSRKTGDGLLFSVIKFSTDKGMEVPATGQSNVERKASGTIIVYNTGTQVQRFRATTRFATPEGKVYQVQDAISVPAKGSIETLVYAEKAGAEFNIGLSDFVLPGLKGTSLASTVYARSKTEMTGGFVGIEKTVESADKTRVRGELEESLRAQLISEARAQVPEDFILIPSLSSISFEELPQSESQNRNSAMVNLRGNLLGVMFKKNDLSTRLVHQKKALAPGEVVDITNIDSLNFSFLGTPPTNLTLADEIRFTVMGQATAIWRTDEVALVADLTGRNKKDIAAILNNYPAIVSATATVRPFWKSSFPADVSEITLKKLPVK